MSLAEQESSLYENTWSIGGYGDMSPGEKFLPIFIDAMPDQFKDALNIGPARVDKDTGGQLKWHKKTCRDMNWRPQTVLDAGTGSGKGAVALAKRGFAVALFDVTFDGIEDRSMFEQFPSVPGLLWDDLKHVPYMAKAFDEESFDDRFFDWAYCCDVMEHIPPQFTMLVVHRLLNIVRQGVFFSISLVPDQFGYLAGEPLHKTVQPFTWWRDALGEMGSVIDCRDLGNVGTYLVMKP